MVLKKAAVVPTKGSLFQSLESAAKWLPFAVALSLIGYVVFATGRSIWSAGDAGCELVQAESAKADLADQSVYWVRPAGQSEIALNERICLGVKIDAIVAQDRAALVVADHDVAAAKAERDTLQASRNAAEAARKATGLAKEEQEARRKAFEDADASLKLAESRLAVANADRAKLPAKRKLALAIDDVAVPGTQFAIDVRRQDAAAKAARGWKALSFTLRSSPDATTADAKAWRSILGGATQEGTRSVRLGVIDLAEAEAPQIFPVDGSVVLRIFEPSTFAAGALGMVALFAGFFLAGRSGQLLRDARDPRLKANELPPYSLARVQLMLWMFLVIGGFLFIWLVTGQGAGVVNEGALTLLGISGVTAISARAIDAMPRTGAAPPAAKSKTLFSDILSDDGSLALHRIQVVIWNAILGLMFAWSVFWDFAFPQFGQSLLILAGIVNTTYVGFKFPESR